MWHMNLFCKCHIDLKTSTIHFIILFFFKNFMLKVNIPHYFQVS